MGRGGRRDEQICKTRAAESSRGLHGGEHEAIHSGRFAVERERVPGRGRLLQPVLTPCPFLVVGGRVRSGGEHRQGDGRESGFVRKQRRVHHARLPWATGNS